MFYLQLKYYRNFGLGDKNVKYELRTLKHQKNEVIMTVGKHTVQVPCKNKRDGKQRAAQAILQVNKCCNSTIIAETNSLPLSLTANRRCIRIFQVGVPCCVSTVLIRSKQSKKRSKKSSRSLYYKAKQL